LTPHAGSESKVDGNINYKGKENVLDFSLKPRRRAKKGWVNLVSREFRVEKKKIAREHQRGGEEWILAVSVWKMRTT